MKKAQKLLDKLGSSLDKANTKEAKAKPGRKPLAPPAPLAPADRHCTKVSVSLFDGDLQRIKAIRAYMLEAHDVTLSVSQVIKLALRTAPLSDALWQARVQAADEDGRRW